MDGDGIPEDVRSMGIKCNRVILAILAATLILPVAAQAQESEIAFHWAPSPIFSESGDALSPAVEYEVWVTRDTAAPQLLATVKDTTYTLAVEPGVVHRLSVRGVDAVGRLSPMSVASEPVYIEYEQERGDGPPMAGTLRSNYPNPFNPETRIVYGVPADLPAEAPVRLEIFNLAGQRVRSLDVERTPGWHEVMWNGTDDAGQAASSGLYVTRFIAGSTVQTQKMTMLK